MTKKINIIRDNIYLSFKDKVLADDIRYIFKKVNHGHTVLGLHGKILQSKQDEAKKDLTERQGAAHRMKDTNLKDKTLNTLLEEEKALNLKYKNSIDKRESYVKNCIEPYMNLKEELDMLLKIR